MPKIPESGADMPERTIKRGFIPSYNEAYIYNSMHQKEFLTPQEAILLINGLSGALAIDGIRRTEKEN